LDPASTPATSEMGIIAGLHTPTPIDDLIDVHRRLPANQRATHVSNSALDRVLLSQALMDSAGLRFVSITRRRDLAIRGTEDRGRGVDYHLDESEQDVSDHFPLLAVFNTGGGAAPMERVAPNASQTNILSRIRTLQATLTQMQEELEKLKQEIEGQE